MPDYLDHGILVETNYFDECVLDHLDRMVNNNELENSEYSEAHNFVIDEANKRFNSYLKDKLLSGKHWDEIKDIIDDIVYEFISQTTTEYRSQNVSAKPKQTEPKLNSHNVNANIVFHELDDVHMAAAGFKKLDDGTWSYSRIKRYKYLTLDFWVHKSPNDDLAIDILDDDFCQPYDYQYMEAQGNVTEYTRFARSFAEEQMKHLADAGILSGHTPGDYI